MPADPTPILDRARPAPAPRRRTARNLLIGAGIGVAASPLFVISGRGVVTESWAAMLTGLFGTYYLAILVHELGHCAMALANGFEFRQLAVAPFVLTREARGYRFQFLPGRLLTGGHLLAAPDSDRDLRGRYLRLLLRRPGRHAAGVRADPAPTVERVQRLAALVEPHGRRHQLAAVL